MLIKHAFPAQGVFESLGGLVDQAGVAIGALDGGLRGDPEPGATAVHVNKRYRIAKVDDNGGASANVSYQLPREPPIVPYLVHSSISAMITPRAVEQRCRDVNGQLRPSDSEFEWIRWGDRSDKATHHHPLGVAADPAIAL